MSYGINEFSEDLAKGLINTIEKGWEKPWVTPFPFNPSTGKEYSGANVFRLVNESVKQKYDDPRWLTYKQAQNLGGQVKYDQRLNYVKCIKWMEKEFERTKEDGTKEKEKRMIPSAFCLYNAQQCTGLPELKKLEDVKNEERHENCEKILAESGVPISNDGVDRAYYDIQNDSIHLPTKHRFIEKTEHGLDDYYSVALHELAHSTGAESRLNRQLTGDKTSAAYAQEELRAEISSMLMGARLGIPRSSEQIQNHHQYLKGWAKLATEDPQAILKACKDANEICKYLKIEPLFHPPEKTVEKENVLEKEFKRKKEKRLFTKQTPKPQKAKPQPTMQHIR